MAGETAGQSACTLICTAVAARLEEIYTIFGGMTRVVPGPSTPVGSPDALRPAHKDFWPSAIMSVALVSGCWHAVGLASWQSPGVPRIGALPDLQRWWRYGQETFVALQPNAWRAPDWVTEIGWLDTFVEMKCVREAVAADSGWVARVDTSVGPEFSLQERPLEGLLIEYLLRPMVVAGGAYQFSDPEFDAQYSRLEAGLLSDVIRMVEVVPLNGFVSNMDEIVLAEGLSLRPMSDLQISRAIQSVAVPPELAGLANSVTVSRFHQWALTIEHCYPLHSHKPGMPVEPKGPSFPVLEERAERLVTALRIVCGGSVVATRPLHLQHEADFPPLVGSTGSMSAFDSADVDRPTLLLEPVGEW